MEFRSRSKTTFSPRVSSPLLLPPSSKVSPQLACLTCLTLLDFIAPIDSTAVRRLREAGAIVTGSANMDEMGMGSFGLYGYEGKSVKNPIDESHFAGGSSAGSAVIVKSYQALGSLGTDTGGSVNYPAHCCGLFSMKPSFGRISRFGQILYSSSNETTGPFGHSINDVHAFFGEYSPPPANFCFRRHHAGQGPARLQLLRLHEDA